MNNSNLRPMTEYSSKFFSRGSKPGTLVVEASTLFSGGPSRFEQIYDDAIDVGICVKGTNGSMRYALVETERIDGDIICWKLDAIDARARFARVTILND